MWPLYRPMESHLRWEVSIYRLKTAPRNYSSFTIGRRAAKRAAFDVFDRAGPVDICLYKSTLVSFAFSPDGKTLAAETGFFDDELPSFDNIQICDLAAKKIRAAFRGRSPRFSPDGKTLAYDRSGTIELLGAATLKHAGSLEGPIAISMGDISREGSMLAAISEYGTIQFWDLRTRKMLSEIKGNGEPIKSAAFSPNGTELASLGSDRIVRLWKRAASPLIKGR